MEEYHKIKTVFKRDPDTKFKTLLIGQYATPEFAYLSNQMWWFTEKIDGTNIRVMYKDATKMVRFSGRTDNSQIPAFLLSKLQDLFPVDKLKEIFQEGDGCLYGEGFGAKIHKGGGNYIPDGCSFILFDVKVGEWWLQENDVMDVASKLKISHVPVIGDGTLGDAVMMVKEGFHSKIGSCQAEGLVMRPKVGLYSRDGHRIISKIKCKDFPGVA